MSPLCKGNTKRPLPPLLQPHLGARREGVEAATNAHRVAGRHLLEERGARGFVGVRGDARKTHAKRARGTFARTRFETRTVLEEGSGAGKRGAGLRG